MTVAIVKDGIVENRVVIISMEYAGIVYPEYTIVDQSDGETQLAIGDSYTL